jgi:hypothetical protein
MVLGAIFSLATLLATTRAGFTVLFFVAFAAVISAASGAALLAIDSYTRKRWQSPDYRVCSGL